MIHPTQGQRSDFYATMYAVLIAPVVGTKNLLSRPGAALGNYIQSLNLLGGEGSGERSKESPLTEVSTPRQLHLGQRRNSLRVKSHGNSQHHYGPVQVVQKKRA